MHIVNDTRKLAQLLLKWKKIDRTGFDHILSRLSAVEKSGNPSGTNGRDSGAATKTGAWAINFIAGLKIKSVAPDTRFITDVDIAKSLATGRKDRSMRNSGDNQRYPQNDS